MAREAEERALRAARDKQVERKKKHIVLEVHGGRNSTSSAMASAELSAGARDELAAFKNEQLAQKSRNERK